MSSDDEQGKPRLPRAESVLAKDLGVATEYRAYGLAADSFERFVAMLEVRLRTGDRLLFAYHALGRAVWNPSRGITLVFPDLSVTIKGRNLAGLFSGIREQRVAWVWEADHPTSEVAAVSATVVELIETSQNSPR